MNETFLPPFVSWLNLDTIGAFFMLAGFVIGLGAVTVIDLHGFLARKSAYWTEATIRTHKVTKPLIWLGILLAIGGGILLYRYDQWIGVVRYQSLLALALIINGCFLSFKISPFLLKQEQAGHSRKLLPIKLQRQITASFLISFVGWWSALFLSVIYLLDI